MSECRAWPGELRSPALLREIGAGFLAEEALQVQMPGRQQSGLGVVAGLPPAPTSRASARVVVPRLVALALLVGIVAAIAALGGYAAGRGSVDQDALQAKAYAQGQLAGEHTARRDAAGKAGAAALSSQPASVRERSHVITGPSAEVRAQLRRAYAAGAASARARSAQSSQGRARGAAAALGNFSGWAIGRWYIVRVAPGGAQSGGQPTIASRLGPLTDGAGYMPCRGGAAICPVGGG
jgi:hypothetical protein